MITLKKKITNTACAANRCKAPIADSRTNAYHLCEKHLDEWIASGCAPLSAVESKPSSDLDAVRAEVIEPARVGAENALATAATIELTQFGLDWLGKAREAGRAALAELETRRTSVTKPLLEAKRAADELFRPAKEQCKALVDCCTDRLETFAREQRAAQDAALAKVALGPVDSTVMVAATMGGPQLPAEVTQRVVWAYEITDLAALPRELMVPDHDAIKAYVHARKGQVSIPGVRVYQDVKVVAS